MRSKQLSYASVATACQKIWAVNIKESSASVKEWAGIAYSRRPTPPGSSPTAQEIHQSANKKLAHLMDVTQKGIR